MNNSRAVIVPITERAFLDLCYYDSSEIIKHPSNEYKIWIISDTEFSNLLDTNIFDEINKLCGSSIADGDCETFDHQGASKILKVLNAFSNHTVQEFIQLQMFVELAVIQGTGIDFNFRKS